MPAKLKVDQVESVDGSANITLNNSITMATNQTLPAASLTGTVAANTVNSDSYVDGSIDEVHLSDNSVDSRAYVDGSIDEVHLSDNSVDSRAYVDGSIDEVHLSDNSVDSRAYVDDSIDSAHLAAGAVDGTALGNDSVDSVHIVADSIDAEHYAPGSVNTAALADNAVTAAKIPDNAIDSQHYAATSIDNEHLADDAVGVAELSATGTASATTFLRGDNAWVEASGGVVQMNSMSTGNTSLNSSSGTVTLDSLAFASAHTTGNGVWIGYPLQVYRSSANGEDCWIYFKVFDGSTELSSQGRVYFSGGAIGYNNQYVTCLFPAITSTATLTVKITAATNGGTTKAINSQDNARQFFIQEIKS